MNTQDDVHIWWILMQKALTCKRYVSFEFLKGTWSSFFAIAKITSLRADRLLLIA